MDRVGIEFLSVFSLPPVQYVNLAADLGCHHISTGLTTVPGYNPHAYPAWSLREDRALRQEMIAVMRDRGVSISLGEGFSIRPNMDVRERAADLALMCELGVRRINAVAIDPDRARSFDQLAVLAEMAAACDVETTMEFGPGMTVGDLATAVAAVRHVGRPDFRLLIDTMHLCRSGSGAADLAALAPAMIGYVQLCDVPLVSKHSSYMEEAMGARMVPGTGELPLRDILAALPRQLVVSLEVPQLALAEAGVGPYERLGRCVKAARGLLTQLDVQ
ncbi:MAG: Xylose isomerase domain protein barrel [Hydrocarboniphaga sp.]|uniref:sugar phosphate isomerase/epimerase family protein n=1 Tax=Hydrocarboniphaga sp. TaxID=2033016 RepID=UPI00262EB15B|nr:TIM barrel protein [Hydrocarboniphaga sp.]MDB5970364.1 Xylose isomerase domain protein barrel [Hydrocarboniphaga sp.]